MAFRDSRKKIDEGKEIHVWYIGCVENCFLNIAEEPMQLVFGETGDVEA